MSAQLFVRFDEMAVSIQVSSSEWKTRHFFHPLQECNFSALTF
jgi:hypothetical protein